MALTVPQLEAHLGRFLRLFLTHIDSDVSTRLLASLTAALMNGGRQYVLNGNLGTQADRREAMETTAKALYQALTGRNADDGGAGQEHFTNHWLPAQQRGEL